MIIIGICDDDEGYRGQIRTICSSILNAEEQEYEFVEFATGEEVLAYQGERIHLLVLDIEMPGMDGLKVLAEVRRNERFWRIVFVTSHKELRWETVDLKTLAFLEKPLEQAGVESCLKTVIRENRENIDIAYKTLQGTCFIRLDRVVFIQARGNYINVCSESEEIPGYDSIKTMEGQTRGTTLIRAHKSYLVNLQYVKKVSKDSLTLTNGTVVPVGRTYYQGVKDAYFAFVKSITIDRKKEK